MHSGNKCSRHVWMEDGQVFTTGVSKMREREYALFDPRKVGGAVKRQRVDDGMGVLLPVVDRERGIVYLGGRVSIPLFFPRQGVRRLFMRL